ncbi:GDP-mannose 4,6-dehydratase [Candidatus Woesearchaeota archaeon]|nr:GDP-mannose 4,6-dehydratase [Candidatus Woesearchaeota archaeon]
MAKFRVLITGGAGFIGHHLVEGVLKETDWEIVIMDRLDVSGSLERLRDISIWEREKHRVKFIWWDLKAPVNQIAANQIGKLDYIWHLAASSHVDRSIQDPLSFVMDNVVGTCNILNFAREIKGLKLFIYFSTDEVFGPAPEGVLYKEWDRYKSGNPYAATKAGAEELCVAFENTYKLPIIVTHTMNCFGERQHPEKFIPMCIRKILNGETVTIHSDKTKTKSGSRFYIHARNVGEALLFLTKKCQIGEKYNLVGEREVSNLDLAKFIAKVVGKELKYEMVDFHSSRPGHDLRYALDGTKLKELGFEYPKTFEESMAKTVKWTLEHKEWL